MGGWAETAFRVAREIDRHDTPAAIQDAVRKIASPLGYDRFVLFAATASREALIQRIYWMEGPWFKPGDGLDTETYLRRCPVTRHALNVREPFFWTKREDEIGERYTITPVPRGAGVHGLQVPVFGPFGLEGAMSLGGGQIQSSPAVRQGLTLVGTAAFLAMRRLMDAPTSEGLGTMSEREREILAWTAAGQRQGAIATMLGLSERTVENHLRRIRKRLGVATTAQAVKVAARNGDIDI